MSDHTQSDHALRQSALNAGLREAGQKPIRQMLEEKDRCIAALQEDAERWANSAGRFSGQLANKEEEIAELKRECKEWAAQLEEKDREIESLKGRVGELTRVATALTVGVSDKDKEIVHLTALLSDAMAVMGTYINVPEALALRERWGRLKSQ